MKSKPLTSADYSLDQLNRVFSVCLHISTIMGDFMNDLVIVGGLVPNLIILQAPPPEGADVHVGTQDLDLGLSLGVLNSERYQEIAERLRGAGFHPDVNQSGNPAFQRWKHEHTAGVTIDFLIPQTSAEERGGTVKHLEKDFGAVVTPGLELAFRDRIKVSIGGQTPFGEKAERDVWVCGPGAYIILKALAFDSRGENKDAYDLFYVVRNFGGGYADILAHLRPLLANKHGKKAIEILKRDFSEPGLIGPVRVAKFLFGRPNEEIQVEAAAFINQILDRI